MCSAPGGCACAKRGIAVCAEVRAEVCAEVKAKAKLNQGQGACTVTVVKVALPRAGGVQPAAIRAWKRLPSVTTPRVGMVLWVCSSTWAAKGERRASAGVLCRGSHAASASA